MKARSLFAFLLACSAALALAAGPPSFYGTQFERKPDAAALTTLGRALFFDRTLSASGRMACASCHDPAHAWGPPNALAVQLGGRDARTPGLRAVPSLTYRHDTPPFTEHYQETDGNDAEDQGPGGGRGWDGRANSAHEQAALPLLSPFEMANKDRSEVVGRLRRSPAAPQFLATFGSHTFDDESKAWNGLLLALEVFQQSPADFYPYSSKYDAFLRGAVTLGANERRGLALFNDAKKGNCAACHPSAVKHGAFPRFTDDGFVALGVPRNRAIAANADPRWFDLGLCGPLREDLATRSDLCGRFKTPPLRNVAVRRSFFHNGAFHRLEDAVRFYAQRDTKARPLHYDDLPAANQANVNQEPPFGRHAGERPALTEAEIRDIVAFLRTLTDGYTATKSKGGQR
jgi:cytochrome c peroxidase